MSNDVNKNASNKLKNKASTVLIILGLIIISIPIIGKIVSNKRQEAMLKEFYLELENNDIQEESNNHLDEALSWGAANENQVELIENLENIEEGQIKEAKIKALPKAIGIITIDKIGVKLPIAEGIDLDTLRFTIGHMPGTAPIGGIGNTVLAGHRSHSFGAFFNRLDELNEGDEIIIQNDKQSNITYKVYKKIYVDPDDTSVLNGSSKNKVLTLITCHPEINPDSRLIIHAIAN